MATSEAKRDAYRENSHGIRIKIEKDRGRRINGNSQGAGFGGHYLYNGRHFQSGLLLFVYPQIWSLGLLVHPVNLVKHVDNSLLDNAQVEHDVAHGHMSIVAQQV